ncbi:MAG TPA: preprotein translocase subunit SecY, partial [Phycisphaerales bacterium]|nr:preprotein translocase subunit SecY [Phycisphaerales bacterium]
LCIYRIGFHVPLPGLDQEKVKTFMAGQSGEKGIFGQAIQLHGMLTGGDLSQAMLFGLGIMPYIS